MTKVEVLLLTLKMSSMLAYHVFSQGLFQSVSICAVGSYEWLILQGKKTRIFMKELCKCKPCQKTHTHIGNIGAALLKGSIQKSTQQQHEHPFS